MAGHPGSLTCSGAVAAVRSLSIEGHYTLPDKTAPCERDWLLLGDPFALEGEDAATRREELDQ
jgi:hypothetical protein